MGRVPPATMFRRRVLPWVSDRSFCRSLPAALRLFSSYCRLYFLVFPSHAYPRGVRHVYQFVTLVARRTNLFGSRMCAFGLWHGRVDIRDARVLKVLEEIRGEGPVAALYKMLREGDTFIDIGANHGTFSLHAAMICGESGKVVAIEPQAKLADHLRSLLAGFPCPGIVHQVAVASANGAGPLYCHPHHSGLASTVQSVSWKEPPLVQHTVMRRFDDLSDLAPRNRRVVIKIDVEGSEVAALNGAHEYLCRYRPVVICEINVSALAAARESVEDLKRTLLSHGYSEYSWIESLASRESIKELRVDRYANAVFYPA